MFAVLDSTTLVELILGYFGLKNSRFYFLLVMK